MKLELIFATRKWSGWEKCVVSWAEHSPRNGIESRWGWKFMENDLTGQGLLESYQTAFEESTADILGYCHDDVMMMEDYWDRRVLKEFEDPTVGMVGFGGAKRHGSPGIYQVPYHLTQVGRGSFMSNMRAAETHGARFTGECDVAVLDGFTLFVRRKILEAAGGWPLGGAIGYIAYDYWLSCVVREQGYRIRLVGVACDHLGGKSTGLDPNLKVDFDAAHREIYDRFRNCLPFEVKE